MVLPSTIPFALVLSQFENGKKEKSWVRKSHTARDNGPEMCFSFNISGSSFIQAFFSFIRYSGFGVKLVENGKSKLNLV